MKPIKDWLETLPEPYRTEALAEYDVRGRSHEKQPSLYAALFHGFVWRDSPQGGAYWRHIANCAWDGEFDQPAELEALRQEVAALKAQLAAKEPLKVGDRVRVELPSMEGRVRQAWSDGTYNVDLDGLGEEEDIWLKPERLTRLG